MLHFRQVPSIDQAEYIRARIKHFLRASAAEFLSAIILYDKEDNGKQFSLHT